uniref:Putative secreted protein n=1 Tax=Anopheles marajoara TaxID=58244 RepID=A0A2M4CBP7_9DIPT
MLCLLMLLLPFCCDLAYRYSASRASRRRVRSRWRVRSEGFASSFTEVKKVTQIGKNRGTRHALSRFIRQIAISRISSDGP